MLFHARQLLLLALGLAASTSASPVPQSPSATAPFKLWAFGSGAFSGYPVFYLNGLAYVGQPPTADSLNETAINITPMSSDTTKWACEPSDTSISWKAPYYFYIIPDSGFTSVGFTTTSDLPAGATTTSFSFVEDQVFWTSPDGDLESAFWVSPVSSQLWQLNWNADGTNESGSVPVSLKKRGPSATETPPL
jgi:hypothetical protein